MSMDKLFDGSDAHLLPEIELKQLIEDAAKLIGLEIVGVIGDAGAWTKQGWFNPCDPERGDLMKVWIALPECTMGNGFLDIEELGTWTYKHGDHDSLALAVLRAASAVQKARNGNAE